MKMKKEMTARKDTKLYLAMMNKHKIHYMIIIIAILPVNRFSERPNWEARGRDGMERVSGRGRMHMSVLRRTHHFRRHWFECAFVFALVKGTGSE